MTEEEKIAVLWEIAHEVAKTDTTYSDDFGGLECVFCHGDPTYVDGGFNHELGCIVIRARALVELKGS